MTATKYDVRYSEILEARQPWRRYKARSTGFFVLFADTHKGLGIYDTGIVTTGKTEVYAGVYVRLLTPAGDEFIAEHGHDPVAALRELDKRLFINGGWILYVVGLDKLFSQSPMTFGTPWGCHPDFEGAVHMLEPPHGRITIGDEGDSGSGAS